MSTPHSVPSVVRQTALDYMKAFLVIGMVLAHALQLLSLPKGLWWGFSTAIDLITFSGFFFCFGYVFFLVYLSKPPAQARGKMAKTAWKTLLGYYISAFASAILLGEHRMGNAFSVSVPTVLNLFLLTNIPWYSEFLLSFCLITVLVLLVFTPVKRLLARPVLMLGISLACLLTAALLPTDLRLPTTLGLLIGTRTHFVFPIVQYLPIFLTGLYFAQHRIVWNPVAGGVGVVGTLAFVVYYGVNRQMPPEYLPSFFWLVGSYGILYGYFLLASWLDRTGIRLPSLLAIGRNTLLYLILSNIFLFALSGSLVVEPPVAAGIGVIILLVISFLLSLVTPAPSTGSQTPAARATAPGS